MKNGRPLIDIPEEVRRQQTQEFKWDLRWLRMAKFIGEEFSIDPSRKVGAVVTRNMKKFVSMGYNGFAEDMPDDIGLYIDRESKLSRTVHAEMNAVSNAIGDGPFTLYSSFHPCDRCIGPMRNKNIRRAVFPNLTPEEESRWAPEMKLARQYMDECGIQWKYLNLQR